MMGTSEGTLRYQATVTGKHSRNAVYLCYFQSLLAGQFRQYRAHTPCQHGFSGARDTHHQYVMSTCGGHLQSTLCHELSLYIGKIIDEIRGLLCGCFKLYGGGQFPLSCEILHQFIKIAYAIYLDSIYKHCFV